MAHNDKIQLFEDKRIRTAWDEEKEEWYFSIVDVVAVLTDQPDQRGASNYWAKLKKRAWMHTGNNRAVITLKTTFAETNYFHRCTSLSLYKICRAQSAVRTSVPCNYILKLAARGGRQFPLVFCQKEVYNANKTTIRKEIFYGSQCI